MTQAQPTFEEMIERAISEVLYNYSSECGIRNLDGEKAYRTMLHAYRLLFGEKEWSGMVEEIRRRFDAKNTK